MLPGEGQEHGKRSSLRHNVKENLKLNMEQTFRIIPWKDSSWETHGNTKGS